MSTESTSSTFVHLHLNTNYSFNHGLVESRAAAGFCEEKGMTACACTDHGTLGVVMRFKYAMESHGIKPIYGCEFLVGQSNESFETSANVPNQHQGMTLVCLAETLEGYRNLCRLASEITMGDLRFEMSEQYISKELLRKHHKGLIALSGGPTGEVARKCRDGEQAVDEAITEYLDIFGKGNFFLEMQDHGLPEEQTINQALLNASRRTGVPVVATNDVHYLTKEQAHAHEVLLCLGRGTEMANPCHPVLSGGPEYYLKSPEEMVRLFHWCPEAIQNTVAIAERCNVVILTTETDTSLNHKPLFPLPAEFQGSHDDYLRHVCKAGLQRRYGVDADAPSHTAEEQIILDRLERELNVIISASLTSELLVVWDLLWDSAHERWRQYNAGCGAVCGSLVAYLMPITDVDPLKYNLLFERCINEERTPYLFFGIDGVRGHDGFLEAAMNRYGWDNVATLVELEPMNTQALLALVAGTLGHKKYKQISDIAEEHWRMKYALSSSRKLQRLVEQKEWAREIVETVIALEETVLRESHTFSALAISDASIIDVCPVDASKICLIDRFEGDELGLLTIGRQRMDQFVEGALRDLVGEKGEEALNHPLPENDSRAFELLCKDDDRFYNDDLLEDVEDAEKVAAIMREHCANEYGELGHLLAKVQPRSMEELIALYAMYRPGPMQFLDEYLRRRSGEIPVTYETPELEPILKETYGLILYQEQLMQIINVISGLSLEKADCIRRSLGKKKVQQTEMWHGIFFEEAKKRGFSDDCLARIWEKLQYHSMHCFPKAHAVARALLLYRVAYIKACLKKTTIQCK